MPAVARTREELAAARADLGEDDVAVVMTMGALHAGHGELIRVARERARAVVVTIFLNPLQFGAGEDLSRYPRTFDSDLAICEEHDVDLVFAPTPDVIYPDGDPGVRVSAGPLGAVLEGQSRPGHFDGVLTVVLKLFSIIRPDVAIFGRKDAQQLACVRRMVLDLDLGIEIVGAPIIRDPDGLALSSRNRFLSADERRTALALSGSLRAARAEKLPGSAPAAAGKVLAEAADAGLDLDYLALVDPLTFTEVEPEHAGTATMIVAARVGSVRLIDNDDLTFAAG